MSATIDNLNAAVDAVITRLGELSAEVTDLKAHKATNADLMTVAAAANAASEQAAADKLTAAVVANTPAAVVAATPETPVRTPAELDAAAAT